MKHSCYTAYIVVNHQTVFTITDSSYREAEKDAQAYIKSQNIEDAEIFVEDTSDKFLDEETFIDRD